MTELQAIRTYAAFVARGETPLGEEVYDRVLAGFSDHHNEFRFDPERFPNTRDIREMAKDLGIDEDDAAHLKAFLRRRSK